MATSRTASWCLFLLYSHEIRISLQRLLSLAPVEWLGIHRLHEVVNQEQEQAPEEDQAHHSQQDEAANEEGVHNLQGRETQRSQHVTAPACSRSLEKRTSGAPPDFSPCFSSLAWALSGMRQMRTRIPAKSYWEC